MAKTYTPNLRLTIDSSLSADAKANLLKIDALGASTAQNSAGDAVTRAPEDISLLPQDASVGGSGIGGNVNFGSPSQLADNVRSYAASTSIYGTLDLKDTASVNFLKMRYVSTSEGAAEGASRTLSLDVGSSNRVLVFNTDFSTDINSIKVGTNTYGLPATPQQLASVGGVETLTNKTIDAASNTVVGLTNANLAPSAAVSYSKLNLAGQLQLSDFVPSLNFPYSRLDLSNSIQASDIASNADIPYGKLNLTGSLTLADLDAGFNLDYSWLTLTNGIQNLDISTTAQIDGYKIVPSFGDQLIQTDEGISLSNGGSATKIQAHPSQSSAISLILPQSAPAPGLVLAGTATPGELAWLPTGAGTVSSVDVSLDAATDSILSVSGGPITGAGTFAFTLENQAPNTFLAGPVSGAPAQPYFRAIQLSEIAGTDEAAQDAVGGILLDTADIELDYDDAAPSISALLTTTGVTPGTYGSNATVPVFTVGSKGRISSVTPTSISIASSNISDAGMANGVATLDGTGKVPASQLPSYVDDVLEYANLAAFPVTGETGKIYIALDTNFTYRWSGSVYVQIASGAVQSVNGLTGAVVLVANTSWTTGTSFSYNHGLSTLDVSVTIYDIDSGEQIWVDSIVRTSTSVVQLNSSVAPTGSGWRVKVSKS